MTRKKSFNTAASLRNTIFFVLLFLCALNAGCPIPQSQNTRTWQQYEIDPVTGKGYYIFVPYNYNENRPIPLIVSCHGTPPYDIADHHVKMWKKLCEDNYCMVVAPELIATDGLIGDGPIIGMLNNERRILSIISQLGYRYNIDKANIMMTGFSGGGFPTYWVGMRHPDIFSTVVPMNCNFSEHNLDGWYPDDARRQNIMIYYGTNDPATIKIQSRNAINYLRRNGFSIETRVLEGSGHDRRPDIAMTFFKSRWVKPRPSAEIFYSDR